MKFARTFLLFVVLLGPALVAAEQKSAPAPAPAAPKLKQFIYVLKLVPRLHDDKAWTDADKAVLSRHVANFKSATASGQLMLAGRTLEPGDKTFGIAIFTATDEAAANAFMKADPCVAEGLMTATLHPFYSAFGSKI
jgi:uncharacterized protein YciI